MGEARAHRRQTRGIGDFVKVTPQIAEAVARLASGNRPRAQPSRRRRSCNSPDSRLHADMMDALYATFRGAPPPHRRGGAPSRTSRHHADRRGDVAPVRGGRLDLGVAARGLVELYEPRRREIDVAIIGE
jgi:hypothetical protein